MDRERSRAKYQSPLADMDAFVLASERLLDSIAVADMLPRDVLAPLDGVHVAVSDAVLGSLEIPSAVREATFGDAFGQVQALGVLSPNVGDSSALLASAFKPVGEDISALIGASKFADDLGSTLANLTGAGAVSDALLGSLEIPSAVREATFGDAFGQVQALGVLSPNVGDSSALLASAFKPVGEDISALIGASKFADDFQSALTDYVGMAAMSEAFSRIYDDAFAASRSILNDLYPSLVLDDEPIAGTPVTTSDSPIVSEAKGELAKKEENLKERKELAACVAFVTTLWLFLGKLPGVDYDLDHLICYLAVYDYVQKAYKRRK